MTFFAFKYRWIIRWHWLAITLMAMIILVSLSVWQLRRAEQKSEILERIAKLEHSGARGIEQLNLLSAAKTDGLSVDFIGQWMAPVVWLLDNQMLNGRVGYDVIVPVSSVARDGRSEELTKLSRAVLVDLGWVEAPLARTNLPKINVPGLIRVQGIFRNHSGSILLGQNLEDKGVWPMRIQRVDPAALSVYIERNLYSGLIYQQQDSVFKVHYHPVVMSPERHRGYALQWALLALAVLIVALAASRSREPGYGEE